jgi:hypothetical protein
MGWANVVDPKTRVISAVGITVAAVICVLFVNGMTVGLVLPWVVSFIVMAVASVLWAAWRRRAA